MGDDALSVLETLETDQLSYYFEADSWRLLAACKGIPAEDFFPTRGDDQEELHYRCEGCAVQSECLAYAILSNEIYGFWGNHSERARRKIRRRLTKARPDLIKAGLELTKRRKTAMQSKLFAASVEGEELESIEDEELKQRLVPKAKELVIKLRNGQFRTPADLMIAINVSPEAFQQRLWMASQLGWVKITEDTIRITQTGLQMLATHKTPTSPRRSSTSTDTPQEVRMTDSSYEWLGDLDIEILKCLASGEIEDGANASGVLAEKIGAPTGPSFSTRLKRLDDEGLIRRRVNGKRTNYLAITGEGSRALHSLGVSVSSNGNQPKPVESVDTSEWSSEAEERLLSQLETARQMLDAVHSVLAENSRLREKVAALVAERDSRDAELAEALAELESARPIVERYQQLQSLLQAD